MSILENDGKIIIISTPLDNNGLYERYIDEYKKGMEMSILDNTEKIDNYFIAEPNDKIALIDADTIVYNACLACEYEYYNTETGEDEWNIDIQEAFEHAVGKIYLILEQTGCAGMYLAFSASSRNTFRTTKVANTYKSNRSNLRYPVGIKEVRELICNNFPSEIGIEVEADDIVVSMYNPDIYILCAIDKDVINSVPGTHWNYYQRAAYSRMTKQGMKSYEAIPAMFVDVSESQAAYWPYYQCITGDSTDGIPGAKGIGPAKLKNFISETKTPKENWLGVVKAYESVGQTEIDAVVNMRLVNMHQYNHETKEVILWTPKDL